MGFPIFETKTIKQFDWRDLNKKIGKIAVIYPGESDINEGKLIAQVMFMDEKMQIYILHEWDVREEKNVEV